MRVINGKSTRQMDAAEVAAWVGMHSDITIDLGAGDGRFVRSLARRRPENGAIALDLCEANLRGASRKAPGNALFVVADALSIPGELQGTASRVTVCFPWGSLLRGLVQGEPDLLAGLAAIARRQATLDVVLNGGALAELSLPLEAGAERVVASLRQVGAKVGGVRFVGPEELRGYPTTWAKRLAFGRDPRAVRIGATLPRRATPMPSMANLQNGLRLAQAGCGGAHGVVHPGDGIEQQGDVVIGVAIEDERHVALKLGVERSKLALGCFAVGDHQDAAAIGRVGLPAGEAATLEAVDDARDGPGGQPGQVGEPAGRHRAVLAEQIERFEVGRVHAGAGGHGRAEQRGQPAHLAEAVEQSLACGAGGRGGSG